MKTLTDAKKTFVKGRKLLVKNWVKNTTKEVLVLDSKSSGFLIGLPLNSNELDKHRMYYGNKNLYKINTDAGSKYFIKSFVTWQKAAHTIIEENRVAFLAYEEKNNTKIFPNNNFEIGEIWLDISLL